MEKITIGKHCQISVINEVPCIHIQWFGLPLSEEFREGCNRVLELMKTHGISKILTDNTQANVFSTKDQHWLNDEWLPRAEKQGYKASATLIDKSHAFANFAARNIAKKRDASKFANRIFESKEEAILWLKTI
jgi:hypothetical protein